MIFTGFVQRSHYKGDVYWNDFELVQQYINNAISSDEQVDWMQHLKSLYDNFDSAFFPSCGNGWVERELFSLGIFNTATGLDIGESMIGIAKAEAEILHMPSNYFLSDINSYNFDEMEFDLVVNHAAMHHVAMINKVSCQLAKVISGNGIYVGFDYIGPHRNQYPWEIWKALVEFNATLPLKYQADLIYPHMETMLHTDPTEAIHSELIIEVMTRYFDIIQFSQLGGALAYQILYQNKNLYDDQLTIEGRAVLKKIIEADKKLTQECPDSTFFAFWLARPKVTDFPSEQLIEKWQSEEKKGVRPHLKYKHLHHLLSDLNKMTKGDRPRLIFPIMDFMLNLD